MIYPSAGHNLSGPKVDPGAVANGYKEATLTAELRDLVIAALKDTKTPFICDKDSETLSQYISRIKPGQGSVVCDIHFNASESEKATGVEVIVKAGANEIEIELASEICSMITKFTGLVNRGVKDEKQSHRGRLGILHTAAGISVLIEVCFISNKTDMMAYNKNKAEIAKGIASLLIKYDALK